MPTFESLPDFEHGRPETLGVLLVNLGTPSSPSTGDVRRYLAEFLWDPRVVEVPRPLWWLILHGFILRFRPSRSARADRKIWTDDGSPLLLHSQALADAVGASLEARVAGSVCVELAMTYGAPSIRDALARLFKNGCRRIICLPLYPQYSGTTTGSVFDLVTRELQRQRWVPEFRFINHYHDAGGYIAAEAQSIRDYWASHGRGGHLLFSFHGLPKKNLLRGDPYHCHCLKTARLIAAELGLDEGFWSVAFQSRVGREEWLQPYTDETIAALGSGGLERLDVVCPGFAADCLETLEEIAMQYAADFRTSGGRELCYIPALNARADHVDFLAQLIEDHARGWPETSSDWDADASSSERADSRQRAIDAGADR
jgi:ferrochelatase